MATVHELKQAEIAAHIRKILVLLGEDPEREGLKETPVRVAKMFDEVFVGIRYDNEQIACMFNKTFDDNLDVAGNYNDMVLVKDISFFSFCEHHMALMYNMKAHVAYIPNGKVIGLSKIARIVDMVGRRLQIQERIGTDIVVIMAAITDSPDVAVIIEGEHSCMTTRGIKKPGTVTRTSTLRGRFMENSDLRNELLLLLK